jgi:EpsD family peptidyl-prolyl cis-trans isomerase
MLLIPAAVQSSSSVRGRVGGVVQLLFVAALLSACSRDRGPAESQIAVRVNDGEVSVHQLQTVLQRQPRLIASAGEAAAGRVLEVLIDQELAAQAAKSQGLESDPAVIQMLQTVRREALARAYQERVAANVPSPTSDEVDRYYESRPELFAQRRIYLLHETAVEVNEAQLSRLSSIVASAQSADDVAKVLRDSGLRHSSRPLGQAAEDLPAMVLTAVAKLNAGQSVLLPHPGGARIYSVLLAHRAPVDRRAAADVITAHLVGERKRQAVNQAMASLRQGAKLEYLGAFVPRAGASAPAGAVTAPVPQ